MTDLDDLYTDRAHLIASAHDHLAKWDGHTTPQKLARIRQGLGLPV